MTAAEKLATLHAWEAQVKAISAVYEADRLACGALIESPRWEAVYGLLDAYTQTVAAMICPADAKPTDVAHWMEEWQMNRDSGQPMEAGLTGQPMREIRTLEDLLWIIEARP